MKNINILVVDDEESIVATMEYQLTKEGFEVDTAESGEEAIQILKKKASYDLLITDLMLGETSGLDVMSKAIELNIYTPVIIITGFGQSSLFAKALKLNPCGHVLKPFSSGELLQTIHKCLKITKQKE